MLVPPERLQQGLEDLDRRRRHRLDAASAPDGRLWAINPEAGFFGVAPGTNVEDQPQRHGDASRKNTIFTNVVADR